MKKVRFLLLAAMVAMFTGCQKEVAEQELDNNKRVSSSREKG